MQNRRFSAQQTTSEDTLVWRKSQELVGCSHMDALTWITSTQPLGPPVDVYCQTRDVVQAKVKSVRAGLLEHGWNESTAALVAAVLGELTSNAFDHNLGQWPDIPGCWFEATIDEHRFSAIVADRGQGVRSSLERVRPGLNDHEALRIAFTEQVTGRAPEKRGNGLKFVMNTLKEFEFVQFSFQSGDAKLMFQGNAKPTNATFQITSNQPNLRGVLARLELQLL